MFAYIFKRILLMLPTLLGVLLLSFVVLLMGGTWLAARRRKAG